MKRKLLFTILLSSVLCLSACAKEATPQPEQPMEEVVEEEPVEEPAQAKVVIPDTVTATKRTLTDFERTKLYGKYSGMLATISMLGRLPEDKDNYDIDMSETLAQYNCYDYNSGDLIDCNHYAFCDVTGDGVDELLVYIDCDKASTAERALYVYSYDLDNDTYRQITILSPETKFYDDGYIIEDSSHNQTFGELWPHSIYKFNNEYNVYDYICYVESWDKSIYEFDFPAEYDKDNDGVIYIATNGDNNPKYMDKAEFEEFEKQFTSGNVLEAAGDVYPLVLEEYLSYSKEYIHACLDQGFETCPDDTVLDLGRLYVNQDKLDKYNDYYENDGIKYTYYDFEKALKSEMKDKLNMDFSTDNTDEDFSPDVCFKNAEGTTIAAYVAMDNSFIDLMNIPVKGLYILGVQPGMSYDEAKEKLSAFYAVLNDTSVNRDGDTMYAFHIGSDSNYICISLTVDSNNKVINIDMYEGCSYAS